MSLAELFPDGEYRFHLTLRRGDPREFFATQDSTGAVLAQRARWLAAERDRHAALQPEGRALLEEFGGLVAAWGLASFDSAVRLDELALALEPDILFLARDSCGEFRLRGGTLCFPAGWALQEKLGETLDSIHGVVPGLNTAIGPAIHEFLTRLRPGIAYLRSNWGLAATDELNLHPACAVPAPCLPVSLQRIWLRVEHQALLALPETGGIAFGIRIALHRLDEVAREPAAATGLRRALESMPPKMAAYKRIDAVARAVADIL